MGSTSIPLWTVLFVVICHGSCITISSNGHSPDVKMLSIDKKSIEFGGFVPINPHTNSPRTSKSNLKQKSYLNSTALPVNERYRRLIPYMTFYLANDFNDPQNDVQPSKVPLQKIAIPNNVITRTQSSKSAIQYSKVPHYQGNRLTQFNIASSYPDKIAQDYYYNTEHSKYINHNLQSDTKYAPIKSIMRPPTKSVYDFQRPIPVPVKVSSNFNKEFPNSDYFLKSIEVPKQQYKLIPYEQTPPVHVPELDESNDYFESKKYNYYKEEKKPVFTHNKYFDQSYKYTPEVQNYQSYDTSNLKVEKEYEEDTSKYNAIPTMSTGFKPIFPSYASPISNTKVSHFNTIPYSPIDISFESNSGTTSKPIYYKANSIYINPSSEDYITKAPEINYGPSSTDQFEQNNLASILKSLQASNSLPKTITTDNVDSSIKTLVKILKNLKSNNHKYVEISTIKPIISSPLPFQPAIKHLPHPKAILTPFIPSKKIVSLTKPTVSPVLVHEYPSQDLEHVVEAPLHGLGSSQSYPADSNEVGGTPGKLGIDYPALATIPKTSFDCKTQRYKGFFGDPETNCQVWHYCDLNGGQASFLCPNGTIFSQVALTCDWWFNVKCSTTTQLYVLNERLYKYILPFNPKFPEDYSGPLVDKYLTIKYKELEEKMKKKKKISNPEPSLEMQKVDVIEIKSSGMSGALKPYDDN